MTNRHFAELFGALTSRGMMPPATWLPRGVSHRATLPDHYAD